MQAHSVGHINKVFVVIKQYESFHTDKQSPYEPIGGLILANRNSSD